MTPGWKLASLISGTGTPTSKDRALQPFVGSLLSQWDARYAGDSAAPPRGRVSDPLTARERDVLAMISQGLSNKRIARTLEISPETVKSHVKHIFSKLEVGTRTEAVSLAGSLGLLPDGEPAPRPHRDAVQRLMGYRGSIGTRMTNASSRERLISRPRRGGAPRSRFQRLFASDVLVASRPLVR